LNAIIIFIKNPVLGTAKTRLAEEVGDERALKIYKSLLMYTRTVSSMVHAQRYLYYSSEIIDDEWSPETFHKKVQSGNDLGERMANAFKELSSAHDKVVIIGSDCPQLDLMTISSAFRALDEHDHVIGPSKDGGYYLFGMKEYDPSVFEEMTWSTSSVCEETIKRIKAKNKTYKLLQVLSDIDYKEDWDNYGWELTEISSVT